MEQGTGQIRNLPYTSFFTAYNKLFTQDHPLTTITTAIFFFFCALCLCLAQKAFAEDIELVNHPVNTSGLTGLLFTTAPYTLSPGTVEVGASLLSENSVIPDYSITEYPASITIGLPHNSEIALNSSYYLLKEGPTGTALTERKTGDVELLYKWNFLPPKEDSVRPAFALILGGSVPTENNSDMRINAVQHWGARFGLSGGTEIAWRDHIVGIYADAQAIGQDLTEKRLSDLYGLYNAGAIIPISKYQNLQMFAEYSLAKGKKRLTVTGGDYSALTYGLRLVGERFNLTIGTQFLRKPTEGYGSADRMMAMMSVKF
jgi:hypothetical protein